MTNRTLEEIDSTLHTVEATVMTHAKSLEALLAPGAIQKLESRVKTLEAEAEGYFSKEGKVAVAWVKARWHWIALVLITAGVFFVVGRL